MILYPVTTSLLLALFLLLPLAVKWELDKAAALPAIALIGISTGLVLSPFAARWAPPAWIMLCVKAFLIVTTAMALLLWRFFRDPERPCEENGHTILSAADGKVIYVKRFESGEIPSSEKKGKSFSVGELVGNSLLPASGYLIGTSMTYLDVHVNRAPIEGKIRLLRRIKGHFLSLKNKDAVFRNERVATVIENEGLRIGVVQIASRLVRTIIPFVTEQAVIQQGQRIGKIRFGSQVDLIVPDSPKLKILVAPGDRLKAGISPIAHY